MSILSTSYSNENEPIRRTNSSTRSRAKAAIEFSHQAQRLAQYTPDQESDATGCTQAVEAKFITAQDPIIITAEGGRLPAVPFKEAIKLNRLRDEVEGRDPVPLDVKVLKREGKDGTVHGLTSSDDIEETIDSTPANVKVDEDKAVDQDAPLCAAVPPHRTNPLFPPLPTYGPPTLLRRLQCLAFRASSSVLSLCFLAVIVLGAVFTSLPGIASYLWARFTFQDPLAKRPFYKEELRRKEERDLAKRNWERRRRRKSISRLSRAQILDEEQDHVFSEKTTLTTQEEFISTEGGPDPLVCDVSYYARRVGLDAETYQVQTEDGFIIDLIHIYNPSTTQPRPKSSLQPNNPNILEDLPPLDATPPKDSKYPVLLIHGLLQSSGAYCCTDENSLAFYLAKAGLDVWLGNNRCGFTPRHTLLQPEDPRFWSWNIRQMGALDLPALISRVLTETNHPKLALIAHSQGTTQTLVALAKEQRPEIGLRISVACLLAPAAYAGPLIQKFSLKFMRIISPAMFRCVFGIHSFIPFMMTMHKILPGKLYSFMGYRVFSFLFDWSDERWERDLRDRFFQFSPTAVSAESMRWWLGRECFAKQGCILSTREEGRMEDEEDEREEIERQVSPSPEKYKDEELSSDDDEDHSQSLSSSNEKKDRAKFAWYNDQVPPFALWIAGSDDLVDGRRLLRRLEKGREPHVRIVHSKIIEEYEHLDVIWAVDAIEQVGREVLQTIWRTVDEGVRERGCRVPSGCEDVGAWKAE